MEEFTAKTFGANLRKARISAGLTQMQVARSASLPRLAIVRAELGKYLPGIDVVVRLAITLKVPFERLIHDRDRPSTNLAGIAVELFRLGIQDLQVANVQVPGALRRAEEVIVLALRGDQVNPRIVEALPFVLSRRPLRPLLFREYANIHDRRAIVRLAWLCDITKLLAKLGEVSVSPRMELRFKQIQLLAKLNLKSEEADDLGFPAVANLAPVWKKWKIAYSGTIVGFRNRIREVKLAYRTNMPPE